MIVYVLTNQAPDYSAPSGAPISVHATVESAKMAYSNGKYMDSWRESNGTFYGPDGFGSIIPFELQGE